MSRVWNRRGSSRAAKNSPLSILASWAYSPGNAGVLAARDYSLRPGAEQGRVCLRESLLCVRLPLCQKGVVPGRGCALQLSSVGHAPSDDLADAAPVDSQISARWEAGRMGLGPGPTVVGVQVLSDPVLPAPGSHSNAFPCAGLSLVVEWMRSFGDYLCGMPLRPGRGTGQGP